MINSMKTVELMEGLTLHLVQSNKFKTDLIGVFIKRPLRKEDAAKNALITRVLDRGTKKLNKRLDDLYGSILVSDVHKYGEKHIYQFKMQVPDKRYVLSENIFKEAIDTLYDLIYNPLIINESFKEEYISQEKMNLIRTIKSIKDDKIHYAMHKCIENMCASENYSVSQNGDIDSVEAITGSELLEYYKEVLETSPIDICVIGKLDFEYVERIIREKFLFKRSNIDYLKREEIKFPIKEVKTVEEEMFVEQGKLTLGYRTNTGYEDPLYEASVLAVSILGGGANSKLFLNIREERSLCYYIYAKLEKYKSILLITAGINSENKDQVIKLIKENLNKIKSGEITENELSIARQSLLSSIKSRSDYPNSFINYYYGQLLTGRWVKIDEIIERYKRVTIEDIKKVSKRFNLDTIHFIKSKDKEDINEN